MQIFAVQQHIKYEFANHKVLSTPLVNDIQVERLVKTTEIGNPDLITSSPIPAVIEVQINDQHKLFFENLKDKAQNYGFNRC